MRHILRKIPFAKFGFWGMGGLVLTRLAARTLTAPLVARLRKVEEDAQAVVDEIGGVEDDDNTLEQGFASVNPETVAVCRTHEGQRKFVAKLVVVARAEFGAPRPEVMKGVLREATYIKVATYLRKYCRDHNVRARDIADCVDDAVALYFVPTRRDLRRAYITNSTTVNQLHRDLEVASNPLLNGIVGLLMKLAGRDVKKGVGLGGHEVAFPR